MICESGTLDARSRTDSNASFFRLGFFFGVLVLVFAGDALMTAMAVSTASSGSGVEIEVIAFSAGSERWDFAFEEGSVALDFVTRVGLLLKERVDCEACDEAAAMGAPDFRRVAGMLAAYM